METWLKAYKLCHSKLKTLPQNQINLIYSAKDFEIFAQSGGISPNLATLAGTSKHFCEPASVPRFERVVLTKLNDARK